MKKAFVTGVTGQDGSYLAEFLLTMGYEVHGLIRRSSSFSTSRIEHLYQDRHDSKNPGLLLHYGDLNDSSRLGQLLAEIRPDEIYNLGAQSHVRVSFDMPEFTGDVTGLGAMRLLEACRTHAPEARIYQASSSEMFGASPPPQGENTPFYPRSPYGVAKVYAFWATKNYREAYNLFATNGILFNHESPRRGETFVTRKITKAAARIHLGLQSELHLGNLDAVRDWGYAPEYVVGMWKMLQADAASDYVLSTGVPATIRQFLDAAFSTVGLDWQDYVRFDPRYLRPTEVDTLIGDSSSASNDLDWVAKTTYSELASLMVEADVQALSSDEKYWIDKPRFNAD